MRPATPARDAAAGVTLIEMLVAMALFAIIATAGFTVLDQVVRVQDRTAGRLDRLAAMQRTMQLVTQDLMFASSRSLAYSGGAVAFRRTAADGEMAVRYTLEGTTLVRTVSGGLGTRPARQPLLGGVAGLRWAFLDAEGAWSPSWPAKPDAEPGNPAAVELNLALAPGGPGLSGELRRVAVLPSEASAP